MSDHAGGRAPAPLAGPLYVILDAAPHHGRGPEAILKAVIAGGCRLVQLREKRLPPAELWPLAVRLRERCRAAGATLIVNDRVDLAIALGADGVHVGQDDLPAPVARRILPPGMLLGVSTHSDAQARRALAAGADYVAVGSMFPTGSKEGFDLVGPELVRRLRPEIPVPLVAIGGITPENVGEVIAAGADAVAVISAVSGSPDPEAAARVFLDRIGAAARGRTGPGRALTHPEKSL
ncbi:MAG: thiamine phosphate synthase [Candidatus Rokubacteria bacterium]|nr:thiamine phosphate synthase [Candidatus Rokubacteria bacterium]